MGFIGQNGAGKTTTIKLLLNLIKKDSGNINMLGLDLDKNEYQIKSQISAVFDEIPFHEVLNANQISVILSDVFEQWDKQTYFNYLDRFALPRKKNIGSFSKGMKMKLQIAAALSHNARLLIMDEATTGLDPVVRNEILDIFMEYLQDENNSILLSSHITSDLEKIADMVTFIDKGKILLTGGKDETVENHAVIKCKKDDYKNIESADIVSARLTDFGAEVMIHDRAKCEKKYAGLTIDNTTLEEIMLFYVRREKKEWK
jgi:ABC-2 type transport system ATP-binding protein